MQEQRIQLTVDVALPHGWSLKAGEPQLESQVSWCHDYQEGHNINLVFEHEYVATNIASWPQFKLALYRIPTNPKRDPVQIGQGVFQCPYPQNNVTLSVPLQGKNEDKEITSLGVVDVQIATYANNFDQMLATLAENERRRSEKSLEDKRV